MKKNAATFNDIRYCYGDVCAVHQANFAVPKGELTVLVGPNGGGKSTLIKLFSGLIKPDNGNIEIEDNATIGYVAQSFDFDDTFPITVKEIVLTGTLNEKISLFFRYSKEQKEKAREAIIQVDLQGFENRGINQLSGGQIKRVIIARALASDADIIVLDEPDSNLDTEALEDLYILLNNLKKLKTILMVSHNIDRILDIADSAIYVNGTVEYFKNPKQLKEKLNKGMAL